MNKCIRFCLDHICDNGMKYIQEVFDTNRVIFLGPKVDGFLKYEGKLCMGI